MLQNPPSSPGCGGVAEVNCVPESPASQNIWAITPMPAIVRRGGLRLGRHIPANSDLTTRGVTSLTVNGGNCTIRGATRRRHADRTHLMLQNPQPALASCSRTSAGLPDGAPINTGRESPAMTRGRQAASSAARFVADEAKHPIGKIQPQLIRCNPPDRVEPSDGMAPIGGASTLAQ